MFANIHNPNIMFRNNKVIGDFQINSILGGVIKSLVV